MTQRLEGFRDGNLIFKATPVLDQKPSLPAEAIHDDKDLVPRKVREFSNEIIQAAGTFMLQFVKNRVLDILYVRHDILPRDMSASPSIHWAVHEVFH